jgi:hypothetical protein
VRDDLNWVVATLAKAGEKSRTPGETVVRNQTYHGSLAQECAEAAFRVADQDESDSLRGYAQTLREIVNELRQIGEPHGC